MNLRDDDQDHFQKNRPFFVPSPQARKVSFAKQEIQNFFYNDQNLEKKNQVELDNLKLFEVNSMLENLQSEIDSILIFVHCIKQNCLMFCDYDTIRNSQF